METNLALWENFNRHLEHLEADRGLSFTNAFPFTQILGTPISYNDAMMQERILKLESLFPETLLKIVEIGGGYGNFCKNYKKANPKSEFTIVDNPIMHKFSKVFLDVHNISINHVNPEDVLNINDEFDLFVAFSSLSEIAQEYRKTLFSHILPKCKFMIIGETLEGIASCEDDLKKTPEFFNHFENFKKSSIDQILYPSHALYSARRKD